MITFCSWPSEQLLELSNNEYLCSLYIRYNSVWFGKLRLSTLLNTFYEIGCTTWEDMDSSATKTVIPSFRMHSTASKLVEHDDRNRVSCNSRLNTQLDLRRWVCEHRRYNSDVCRGLYLHILCGTGMYFRWVLFVRDHLSNYSCWIDDEAGNNGQTETWCAGIKL